MIKTICRSGVLLFAAALFAVDTAAAGPCSHIHDQGTCDSTGECFWDTDDNRCEQRGGDTGKCGSISDNNQCDNTPGCFWDTDDDRCETR